MVQHCHRGKQRRLTSEHTSLQCHSIISGISPAICPNDSGFWKSSRAESLAISGYLQQRFDKGVPNPSDRSIATAEWQAPGWEVGLARVHTRLRNASSGTTGRTSYCKGLASCALRLPWWLCFSHNLSWHSILHPAHPQMPPWKIPSFI